LKPLERGERSVDHARLNSALERFEGSEETRHVVARQARDLADSGRIAEDFGYELTVADVLDNLDDAPDGHTLAERWNWWIGSLEVSHGGYHEFRVRR
jgi:hypothetical protein